MRAPLVRCGIAVLLAAATLVANPRAAHADDKVVAVPTDIETTIGDDAKASRLWFWGWLGIFGGIEGGELVLYATSNDRDARDAAAIAAIATGVGIVASVATFPPTLTASSEPPIEGETADAKAARVARRRELLERTAASERLGRSILAHSVGFVLNGAGGLYLAIHDKAPWRGAFSFVSGMVVAEARIWTQPTLAMDHVSNEASARAPSIAVDVAPMVTRGGTGLMVLGRF